MQTLPMFQFTIRDLLWLTVVFALAVGWSLEHLRSNRLEQAVSVVENEARQSRVAIKSMYDDLERIEQDLPAHGLSLVWSRDMRPSVQSTVPLKP